MNAMLWYPVGVQSIIAHRFRGFAEHRSPPATLCTAVGGCYNEYQYHLRNVVPL